MDSTCPYCGFVNKPQATRCECCLGDLEESPAGATVASAVAPVPPAATAATVPSVPAPVAAKSAVAPPAATAAAKAPLSPPKAATQLAAASPVSRTAAGVPSLATREQFQAPIVSPEVSRGSRIMLVGTIMLGIAAGAFLILPQSQRKEGGLLALIAKMQTSRSSTEAEQPATSPASESITPSPATPAEPGPAVVRRPVAGAPAAPAEATAAQRAEQTAQAQYQLALNFLGNQELTQARAALQEIMQKYPRTQAGAQARDLLRQIPEQQISSAARNTQPSEAQPVRPAEPRTMRERLQAERASVRPSEAGQPWQPAQNSAPGAKRVIITPALEAARPQRPAESAILSPLDDVRVVGVTQEPGRLVLAVEYRLATQKFRPVYIGAWVQMGGASRYFGYSPAPVGIGTGTARVPLPGASPDLTSVRVSFFEHGGQRFFVKDVPLPR